MIHKTLNIAYRFKNFRQHMGITDRITLSGLLRRYTRKYPRVYSAIKKGSVLVMIYCAMMSLIPGNDLPLQKKIKISGFAMQIFIQLRTRIIMKGWFYNIIAPEPEQYLIKLNQIILKAIDGQLYDIGFLQKYFTEIQELIQIQQNQLKSSSYLDLLLYSQIILQNIIRYQKRFLLQSPILVYYEWVYNIVLGHLYATQLTNNESKHVKLVYPLIQYLFKYSTPQVQTKCVHIYYQLSKKRDKGSESENSFRYKLMRQAITQPNFKATLKELYSETQNATLKGQIIGIFEELNKIYERQNKMVLTD